MTCSRGSRANSKVHAEITQSEVDENFAMFVPIFADLETHDALTPGGIAGNSSKSINFIVDRQPKKVALNVYRGILGALTERQDFEAIERKLAFLGIL